MQKTTPGRRQLRRLRLRGCDESGQAITEYILIIGLIVIPLAVAVNELAELLKEFLVRLSKMFWGPGI